MDLGGNILRLCSQETGNPNIGAGLASVRSGITIIALIVTIIVLLILAGIVINLTIGENGIIQKAQESGAIYQKSEAREKLELVLKEATIEKVQNEDYNSDTFLDEFIISKIPNTEVNEDYVKIDNYIFTIDRNILQIISSKEVWNISKNQGIIGKASEILDSGYYDISIKGKDENQIEETVEYSVHAIVCDGDLILDGINCVEGATLAENVYEFGDKTTDVATQNENAKKMVILRVIGNLTINEGVVLTACKSDEGYGGPKGMLIYCTGKIINNGTISMTARGAKAEGENVYLWQNEDESFEYIPAIGAVGGDEIIVKRSAQNEYWKAGNEGKTGAGRQTRWRRNRNNYFMGI